MEAERQAFEAALKENPEDWTTRLIYADWLDEHDMPEESDRQRNYRASHEWMAALAARAGQTCLNYGIDMPCDDWRDITPDDLIGAGCVYVDSLNDSFGPDYFVQRGSERLRDLVYEEELQEAYWRHWGVLTGRPVPAEWEYGVESPFSCSC